MSFSELPKIAEPRSELPAPSSTSDTGRLVRSTDGMTLKEGKQKDGLFDKTTSVRGAAAVSQEQTTNEAIQGLSSKLQIANGQIVLLKTTVGEQKTNNY
jgi:hypothetical protein